MTRKEEGFVNRICCCNLKTAGITVAFVEFLLCILAIYGLLRNLHVFGWPYVFWFIVGVLSIFVIFLAIGLLLYAIKKNNARFLIPHISAQIFLIFFLLIVVIVVALLMLFSAYKGIRRLIGHGDYYISDDSTRILGYWIIIVYLAVAFLEVFFLCIVYKLYLYLREYKVLTNSSVQGNWRPGGHPVNRANPNDWYLPPPNEHAHGGSADAGDIYPYDAPLTA